MNYKSFKLHRRAAGALCSLLFWFALALGSGGTFFYFVTYAWLLLLLASVGVHLVNTRHMISHFEIEKNELTTGESIKIRYKIVNNSLLPAFNVKIYPVISKSFGLLKQEEYSLSYENLGFDSYEVKNIDRKLICQRRGFYTLGAVSFELSDPLKLMTSYLSKEKDIEVTVRPKIFNVKETVPALEKQGKIGMSMRRQPDRTAIKAIRPYVDGDDLRDIHWKLTAKTGQLSVKQYSASVSEQVYLYVDGCEGTYMESETLADQAMDLAASLTYEWLKNGISVWVIISDAHKTSFSGRSLGSFGRALDHFTAFSPTGFMAFEDFLEKELRRHREGAKWVSISPVENEKIKSLIRHHQSGQFSWKHFALTNEGGGPL